MSSPPQSNFAFVQLHAKGSQAAPKWINDACSHKKKKKKFAISSGPRHESSCRMEGYSGLQEVTSPALPCVFLTTSAKTHSLRFPCRRCWVPASSGCLSVDPPTPIRSSKPPSRGSFTHRSGLKRRSPRPCSNHNRFLFQLERLHSFTHFLVKVTPPLLGTQGAPVF